MCISYLNVLTTCFLRERNRQFEEAEVSSCQHLIRTYSLASQIGCGMVWIVVTSKLDYHILSLTFALCKSQVLHGVASAQPGLPLGLSRASCFRAQEGAAKWSKFWVFLKQLGTEIFACLGEIMERTLEQMDFPVQVENILWLSCKSKKTFVDDSGDSGSHASLSCGPQCRAMPGTTTTWFDQFMPYEMPILRHICTIVTIYFVFVFFGFC